MSIETFRSSRCFPEIVAGRACPPPAEATRLPRPTSRARRGFPTAPAASGIGLRASLLAGMAVFFTLAGAQAQGPPVSTDERFDQWVFQQDRNVAGARRRLESQLALRIEEFDRACQLTGAQKEKLQLAAKGDMKRFFARYDMVKKKFQRVQNDQQKMQEIWQDIGPLQGSLEAGLFHEESLLGKSLVHILTAEQLKRYDAVVRERRASRHRAAIEMTVAILEQKTPLRADQRSDLLALLAKQTKLGRRLGEYEHFLIMIQLDRIPDEKWKPLFDPMQWKIVKQQVHGLEVMEPFLRQCGEWPDADDKADRADPGPPTKNIQGR
jgi:hypothetical protein